MPGGGHGGSVRVGGAGGGNTLIYGNYGNNESEEIPRNKNKKQEQTGHWFNFVSCKGMTNSYG